MVRGDITIPSVIIVVGWDIKEGIVDTGFPGIMLLLRITRTGGLSLQVYVGGVAKACTGPMNVGQQEINKAT